MAQRDPREIQAALAQPFAPEDLEWRLQTTMEEQMRGLAVPYVTARAIQSRLDDVVGPENWHNEYTPWHNIGKKDAQLCGISIYFEDRGWVTKYDGAEDTDIEPIKGGLSDSMKRSAVQWGIGRVLYNMDTVWVDIEKRGKSYIIKETSRAKLDSAYLAMLKKIGVSAAQPSGAQAQLTPTAPAESTAPPAKATASATSGSKVMQMPTPELEFTHTVRSIKVQPGMTAKSTSLTLEDKDGKVVQAFVYGELPDLSSGVRLKNVKLTQKKHDTVVFYILEHYEIVSAIEQAA